MTSQTYVSSAFLFRAARFDLHLELHVHGVRHAAGDVAVNVIGVEIAGIEIDAHPLALGRPDDFKKTVGLGDDAPVVFDAEKDAPFAGVFADLLERLDAQRLGLLERPTIGATGKDSDVWRAHVHGVVDPLFYVGNLPVAFLAFRQGEHVANGGAADGDATQERVTLEGNQAGLGN